MLFCGLSSTGCVHKGIVGIREISKCSLSTSIWQRSIYATRLKKSPSCPKKQRPAKGICLGKRKLIPSLTIGCCLSGRHLWMGAEHFSPCFACPSWTVSKKTDTAAPRQLPYFDRWSRITPVIRFFFFIASSWAQGRVLVHFSRFLHVWIHPPPWNGSFGSNGPNLPSACVWSPALMELLSSISLLLNMLPANWYSILLL